MIDGQTEDLGTKQERKTRIPGKSYFLSHQLFPLRFNLVAAVLRNINGSLRSFYIIMSRPKVNEKDKRIVQVNIRLTTTEASTIDEYARASGLSPANWIRMKVFTGKFPAIRLSPTDATLYHELKKIGVNLNQAAHKLNQGEFPKDYRTRQFRVDRIIEQDTKTIPQ